MSHKIYALCDLKLLAKHNLSISQYIQQISKYNIVLIQYRDKINDIQIQKQNLKLLKHLTNIPIIINDELQLLDFCDGLHLGQKDLNQYLQNFQIKNKILFFDLLKKKYSNKIFGLSTHNEVEILEANKLNINYIGLGAYKNTATKNVSNILGNKISYLAQMSKHRVGAIGGVKIDDEIKNIDYYVVGSDLLKKQKGKIC
jgi:thiamine-phosphate pyrophosphorylase